ncbi:MAG: UDP-glucose 4-epimerase [Actinomycetota bacterium]|nr:UDP-glucose 4-epimerase [Actinomycetota bacterium]
MKALVTGGAGFIGSSVAKGLLERGDEVRVIDNLSTGFREAIPTGVEFFEGDLRNLDDVRKACTDIEVVFHEAAIRSVPKSVDNPLDSNDSNVTGTLTLLIGASEEGVSRLVYASSSSVYGDRGDEVNKEDMAPNPMSPYAVSKLSGELYCRAWTHLGRLSTVSLRYFNVFGPGQHPESKYSAVFPGFISALKAGKAPEVHWDGEQSRDFSFIDDVVSANIAAGTTSGIDGEVFNIGGGDPKTVNEVLKSVSDAMGVWIDPVSLPKRSGDVRHTRADISKARSMLSWEPVAEWDASVKATVDWFAN